MAQRAEPRQRACPDYERELVLYYYGECVDTERDRINTHLELCRACKDFLDDLRLVLPLTVKADEPGEAFWQSYSRDLRAKLTAAKQEPYWRGLLSSFVTPWSVPALATALTVILALTLTLTRERWQKQDSPPSQEALLEVLPLAENLDFFTAMDLLDSLDLIEDHNAGGGSA
jgi:hypothetical protein